MICRFPAERHAAAIAVSQPVVWGEHVVTLTASIGIATSFTGETAGDEMLRAADIAMYEAKTLGRARFVLAPTSERSSSS